MVWILRWLGFRLGRSGNLSDPRTLGDEAVQPTARLASTSARLDTPTRPEARPSWVPAPAGWTFWLDDPSWFDRHKVLTVLGTIVLFGIVGRALGADDGAPAVAP